MLERLETLSKESLKASERRKKEIRAQLSEVVRELSEVVRELSEVVREMEALGHKWLSHNI